MPVLNKAFSTKKLQDTLFMAIAAIAILFSAFHFWPFVSSKIWHIINVPNLCCGFAIFYVAALLITKKDQSSLRKCAPHISILAYIVINILSISIADNLSRPLNYTLKLALVLIGGLLLFQKAISKPKSLKLCYIFAAIAVSISISVCIYTRLKFDSRQFGFHGNVFKYGTYIGILVPLVCIYLLSGSKWLFLGSILIAVAGVFSAGSVGAIISIFAGLLTGFLLLKKSSAKICLVICLILTIASLIVSNKVFGGTIYKDFALKEDDRTNLRQRYIEWQAEINLLEKRSITGTGAGCVNDYRSNFYYRLPKLNTLKAFDQNGFLAVTAETGLLGLAIFIWILIYYGKTSLKDWLYLKNNKNPKIASIAAANTAGLISAVIANLFSSVHYNGTLIVFVLLLSFISSANQIYGGNTNEN